MYLLNGTLNTAVDAAAALAQLQHGLPAALARPPALDAVLDCAERFAAALPQRAEALGLDAAAVDALQGFCRREALQAKVGRELGEQAFSLRRFDYRQPRFESWRPLGLVAHITPANAPLLPFMAVLESLLAGNVNWLRPSGSDQGRSARLLADFLSHDAAGDLAAHVAVLPLATDQLAGVLA
ncbi:acyl-CoA reductase, partial [Chromobacterium aquaticum]|nr:acyl-CoA reductase [Chromobacterium aquaticum]